MEIEPPRTENRVTKTCGNELVNLDDWSTCNYHNSLGRGQTLGIVIILLTSNEFSDS